LVLCLAIAAMAQRVPNANFDFEDRPELFGATGAKLANPGVPGYSVYQSPNPTERQNLLKNEATVFEEVQRQQHIADESNRAAERGGLAGSPPPAALLSNFGGSYPQANLNEATTRNDRHPGGVEGYQNTIPITTANVGIIPPAASPAGQDQFHGRFRIGTSSGPRAAGASARPGAYNAGTAPVAGVISPVGAPAAPGSPRVAGGNPVPGTFAAGGTSPAVGQPEAAGQPAVEDVFQAAGAPLLEGAPKPAGRISLDSSVSQDPNSGVVYPSISNIVP